VNPAVRYFALHDLEGRGVSDRDLERAKAAIMTKGLVPRLLAKQKPAGHWGPAEDFYIRTKYWGTVWTFILLAEVGADGRDERIRKACEFLLRWSQDRASGGFAYRFNLAAGIQQVIRASPGHRLSLIRFGYLGDPRVSQAVDWIIRYVRFGDGDGPAPKGWPYDTKDACYGRHTCLFGVVKPLKALAEIPAARRSVAVRRTIEPSVEFLLRHRLFKKSHDPGCVAKPMWAKFGFPLMWQTDALEMFDILTGLGVRDKRMAEAAELIASPDQPGQWLLKGLAGPTLKARTCGAAEQMDYPRRAAESPPLWRPVSLEQSHLPQSELRLVREFRRLFRQIEHHASLHRPQGDLPRFGQAVGRLDGVAVGVIPLESLVEPAEDGVDTFEIPRPQLDDGQLHERLGRHLIFFHHDPSSGLSHPDGPCR
jgi:hypothetical protein